MRDVDLAYLAGIVDADGYITIQRTVKSKSAGGTTAYFSFKVGISGGKRQPHDLAVELFGSRVFTYRPKEERYLDQHQWCVTGPRAAEVANYLLPYLRIKHDQARLGIRFQAMLQAQNRLRGSGPMTADDRSARDQLWKEMVELNHASYRQRESASALEVVAAPCALPLFGEQTP